MTIASRCRRFTRFNLSTLFLTFTLLAVLCGWLVERHRLQKKLEFETTDAHNLNMTLSSVTYVNKIYAELAQESPEEFQRKRQLSLLCHIYFLAINEKYEAENQEGISLMHADNSLALLDCKDVSEVRQKVRDVGLVPEIEGAFLHPAHEFYHDVDDFINRTFERRRREPSQPVRVLLEAAEKDDVELLKTAFSQEVHEQSDEEEWKQRLEIHQKRLATQLGEYDPRELSFEYSASWRDGEATLYWKKMEICTMKIIREDNEWKIDEP